MYSYYLGIIIIMYIILYFTVLICLDACDDDHIITTIVLGTNVYYCGNITPYALTVHFTYNPHKPFHFFLTFYHANIQCSIRYLCTIID